MSTTLAQRAIAFGRMIKFSHSVFALPFAFVSGLIAYRTEHITLTWPDLLLLVVCMVSARTAAMGFNRVADRDIDAINPRTRNREIPAGTISLREARLFTAIACCTFIAASFGINTLCGALSFPLLALLLGYSLTKRYTAAAHFVLGLCLGAAPVGVWFSLTGAFAWPPILLCLGVTLWTAGFDIYYSCQDESFDREQHLKSLPARIGAMPAIRSVRAIHAAAVLFYTLFGVAAGMGPIFFVGAAAVAAILAYEAWILRRGDLTRINLAFFNLNGYVSILFALATIADVLAR
ncbi:MAG TPA: UbiA-like polyprenyltransferase [Candidatus Kapabacteria bacterium]|nr:UbiA-like polyprenyltransferase [Candidatus Kapabacteria bacterium]